MKNMSQFSIQKIVGSKIYRYVDGNGVKGRVHFSNSDFTPVVCSTNKHGKTVAVIDDETFVINNLQELDAINNALNNYKKSLKMILSTPSKVIAETNPDFYLKVLEAIQIAVLRESSKKKTHLSSRNPIYDGLSDYALIDSITRKTSKIKNSVLRKKIRDGQAKAKENITVIQNNEPEKI